MASVRGHLWVLLIFLFPPLAVALWLRARDATSSSTPISVLTILSLFYGVLVKTIVYPFYTSPLDHLPSPNDDWFALGHGPGMLTMPAGSRPFEWMKNTPNHGLILIRWFFWMENLLIVTTPEVLAEILIQKPYEFEKPSAPRDFLRRILGDGLVVVEGKQHKHLRKLVTPSFQGHHIKGLVPLFWKKASDFADVIGEKLREKTPDNVLEIDDFASHATLDIIGVAGLGRDFDTLHGSDDQLAAQYKLLKDPKNTKLNANFIAHFFLPTWLVRTLPFLGNDVLETASVKLRAVTRRLLVEKRAALFEKSSDSPDTILTVLFRTPDLSDEEIVDQLLTFLAAGHETTASAFAWTAYMLATHKDLQQRLREEVCQTMSALEPQHSLSDVIDSLEFLNAVCMETFRFWATVPYTARTNIQDTVIAGTRIPKGTEFQIIPAAINRLPALWGLDAEEFVPQRWIRRDGNTHGGANSPHSLITFLHGPRSCIGQGFAKSELKCLVAAFVLRFDFEMADPSEVIVPAGIVTARPQNGLKLRLRDLRA